MTGKQIDKALGAAATLMEHLTSWEWNDPRNAFDVLEYVGATKIYIEAFIACFDDAKESKRVLKALRDDFNRLEENATRRDFGEVATDTALIGYHLFNAIKYSTKLWA